MAKNRKKLPTSPLEEIFRQRVKKWRIDHTKNQTAVAFMLGCERSNYAKKERGEIPYFFDEVLLLLDQIGDELHMAVVDTETVEITTEHSDLLSEVLLVMGSDDEGTKLALTQNIHTFAEKVMEKAELQELKGPRDIRARKKPGSSVS